MNKPLEGVRVVELATFIAAATAGRFMADLGADVIKIETKGGDPLRYTAPGEGRPLDMYENTTWDLENANKRCVSLNMKQPAGMEAFFKLLDTADVFITNWRTQPLVRMGLDYDTLKARYPKLVYAICTGYGEFGPDKDLPGFDYTAYFARGGYQHALRQRESAPMNLVPGIGDHNVGMNLVAGILAALYQAKLKGVGEKVQCSLFETAIFNLGMMVQASQYEGISQHYPISAREAASPFFTAWRTKDDRYIQTAMPDYNTYYKSFMTAIGRADMAEDERYFPHLNCLKNGLNSEVFDAVAQAMEQKTATEWDSILRGADIPFALAQTWSEIRQDPQAEANDCFYDMTYDNGNTRRLVRQPVRFQEMGLPAYNRAPLIGEQGVEILQQLGYDDEKIKAMEAEGALYVWQDTRS